MRFFPDILLIIVGVLAILCYLLGGWMKILHKPMADAMLMAGKVIGGAALVCLVFFIVRRLKKE